MFLKSLLLSFIPIFVAVDAFGVLPIFLSLTEGMKPLLMKVLGKAGSRAISKVFSLFLAVIGVMMVRKGLIQLIK